MVSTEGFIEENKQKDPEQFMADIHGVELKESITLEQVHKRYAELLYIEDPNRIDVVLASALSQKMQGIPLWLILVGASGDMKSAQLNAIRTKDVEVLHNLTSKTLVNGYQDKIKHPDIAPQLDKKIVIIPDMSQILKLPPNDKAEVWGQLRDLYDGYAGKMSGQGTNVKYKDLHVTLLAGSTPAIDGQILIHQDLGTRELIYRTSGNKNKELVMQKCLENEEYEEKINKELRELTGDFLDGKEITRKEISPEVVSSLKNMAQYTAYMRTPAEFDNYTNELRNEVYPEEPTRIIKQFKRMFICLKSLDKSYPDQKALEIIQHIAKSSAFPIRVKIYEYLIKEKTEFSTSQIAERFNIGKSTTKRECSVLEALGLVKCRRESINSQYSDKTYDYWVYNPSKLMVLSIIDNNEYTIDSIISMDGNKSLDQFNTEITPHNLTINTQSHKQHITPQTTLQDGVNKENVVLCGVSGIINEGGGSELDQFSDSELKSAGWTKETLQDALK